jgi:hypothetical protein
VHDIFVMLGIAITPGDTMRRCSPAHLACVSPPQGEDGIFAPLAFIRSRTFTGLEDSIGRH